MKSFLSLVAADMLSHFSTDMRDVTVVFPSKRAGMFLNRELALLGAGPVWTPSYCTMSDLFLSLTPVKVADPVECILRLYGVMRDVLGAGYSETPDDFWSWGEVLMADFDDIDKQLADARAIFTGIADRERLKSLDYLDEHQRSALNRFFGAFSIRNSTLLQEKFLGTWSHMYEVYTTLHDRLLAEGKLWEGAVFRHVTQQMQADENLVGKLLEGKRAIVFAGLGVLVGAERTMMRLVQREGKARFYWDYDISYCDPKRENLEAGFFMKQNLRDFPSAIEGTEAFDNLRHLRDVTFIASTSDNAAARYAGTRLESLSAPRPSFSVVLANEALLLPLLHSIPEGAGDVNVTMGFPIADTPVSRLVMSLLTLQIEGYDRQTGRFRRSFVETLRRQPLFRLLGEEDCFTPQGESAEALLGWLRRLVSTMARHFALLEEPNLFEQLCGETLFRIDRMLKSVSPFISPKPPPDLPQGGDKREGALEVGRGLWRGTSLRRLLRQMMLSEKIPFHSEPESGLQVMGMLETRCLDFEHVLLLSAEEGSLPRSAPSGSFIPEGLREAFGLTTRKHRVAVYAYCFYRLAGRCRHLTCVYNESAAGGTAREMSRFLRQMLAETDIPIRTLWLRSEPLAKPSWPLVVQKTAEVMASLRRRYDQDMPEGQHIMLSPTAINTYMACPVQFYLSHVLGIRREDDPEEGISADVAGTIFHLAAQFFYEWLRGHYGQDTITSDMLREGYPALPRILDAAFDVCWFHPVEPSLRLPAMQERLERTQGLWQKAGGPTLISRLCLLRYLERLVRYDTRHAPFRIIGTERERSLVFHLPSPLGEVGRGLGLSVRVGGRIDRIDEADGHLRIIDYKTGSPGPEGGVKMERVTSLEGSHVPHYLQTFLYALAEMEEEAGLPVKPMLLFPALAGREDYDPSLKVDGAIVDDFRGKHAEAFREGLQDILEDIFDPAKPFTCRGDRRTCGHCRLGTLCGRRTNVL